MDDEVERDNARHRREEQERRARRQKHRDAKSSRSRSQTEKERKRREHAQRILGAQRSQREASASSSRGGRGGSAGRSAKDRGGDPGGTSAFQALFHERAEGFFVDLRFRNAPPRPPVGPAFVGLGLEGELTNKWTRYKARNAVESQYAWRIHPSLDLGVPLAPSAMDREGCYADPAKSKENYVPPPMHPDDEALVNWKGGTGDTATEHLQQRRDRKRAAARLAVARGHGALPSGGAAAARTSKGGRAAGTSGSGGVRLKKHHLQSRILDEATPNFMKKTTYLSNTAGSVHQFTSLAHTQVQRARDVDRALAETRSKYTEMDVVERGFREANAADGEGGKRRRVHPTKKDVRPVWDLPLLPDAEAWGHTYTHVVLDHPPKNVGSGGVGGTPQRGGKGEPFRSRQLQEAIVADVTKDADSARMACTVWVPRPHASSRAASDPGSPAEPSPPAKKSKRGAPFGAVQRYDLDVVPLRDPSRPPVHYVWTVDPARGRVGYRPVGSRVQLSTGRPIVVRGVGRSLGDKTTEVATDESFIRRRAMTEEERREVDTKTAEVDLDLAEKYGLVGAGEEGEEDEEAGGRGRGPRKALSQGRQESDSGSDSDEVEADAF